MLNPDAPRISLSELPKGTKLLGLAPIGVRWTGVWNGKQAVPDDWPRNVARSEFLPTEAVIDGVRYELD